MSSSPYGLDGSMFESQYGLEASALIGPIPPYFLEDQPGLGMLCQSPQEFESRPPYIPGMETSPTATPNCGFRLGVLDDCAKARFYARALEFYLMPNEHQHQSNRFQCLMANCPEVYTDPRDMLKHLKNCKLLAKGVFYCPTCKHYELFRRRSGRRCSWDKDHPCEKILQKSKDFFQGVAGSRATVHQTQGHAYCENCRGWLLTSTPNDGLPGSFNLVQPRQTTKPTFLSNKLQPVMLGHKASDRSELESRQRPTELPSNSNYENSPTQQYLQPRYTSTAATSNVSDVSSPTMSPDGISIGTISSPASSTNCESQPSITRRLNSTSILSKASHRSVRLWGGSNASDHIADQHSTSFYGNISTGQGLEFLSPTTPPLAHESFAEPLSPPLMPTNFRTAPKLRLETPNDDMDLVGSILDLHTPLHRSYSMNHAVGAEIHRTSNMPTGFVYDPLSELSPLFDATPDVKPAAPEPSPSIDPPLPVLAIPTWAPQASPSTPPTGQDLQCVKCPDRTFARLSYLRKHLTTHNPKIVFCDVCREKFTRKDNLTAHIRRVHDPDYKPPKRRRSSSDISPSTSRPKKKGSLSGYRKRL
ncbi:hypothetical protein GGR51DRAFT_238644 [Nemania sp. FL0031]|nr:hypothetical protein GGR51DRAFT_238644 [Nemania sp. FL0031]